MSTERAWRQPRKNARLVTRSCADNCKIQGLRVSRVRDGFAWTCLLVLGAVVSCHKDSLPNEPEISYASGDGAPPYTPAPDRHVVSGAGAIAEDGAVEGVHDASEDPDADRVDAVVKYDAPIVDAAAPMRACDLLTQNCPSKADVCYPSGGGNTKCSNTGLDSPEGVNCTQPDDCDRGLVCVPSMGGGSVGTCLRLCDSSPTSTGCASQTACSPIAGYEPAGYCLP